MINRTDLIQNNMLTSHVINLTDLIQNNMLTLCDKPDILYKITC